MSGLCVHGVSGCVFCDEGTGYRTLAETAVHSEQARYKTLQLAAWNLLHHDNETNRKTLHDMAKAQ